MQPNEKCDLQCDLILKNAAKSMDGDGHTFRPLCVKLCWNCHPWTNLFGTDTSRTDTSRIDPSWTALAWTNA